MNPDPDLAADGVDEVLRVMYDGAPDGATATMDEAATLRLSCADTGDTWLLTTGTYARVDGSGATVEGPVVRVAAADDGRATAASVTANASDLNCWLWNRAPVGAVTRTGDVEALGVLDRVLAVGIH